MLAAAAIALPPAAAAQGPPPSPVRAAPVLEQDLRPRRTVPGELRSPRESRLASIEAGLVEAILVREGEAVAAGMPIARLDAARMRLEQRVLEAERDAAQSDLAERDAEHRQAVRDLRLVEESRLAGAANVREELDATSRLEIAEARRTQARRRLEVFESRLALLSRRIADMEVKAPFDGVVTVRNAESGQWLPAGGEVAVLVEVDRLEAWLAMPQSIAEAWAPAVAGDGSPESDAAATEESVVLRIDATGDERPLAGIRVVPSVDRRGRTFTAIVPLANEGRRLLPGMSVTAYVPAGPRQRVLTVPKDAVLLGERGASVWVVRPGPGGGSVAVPAAVELAFPLGNAWAIRSGGLAAGDLVVVEGNERLMPNAPISLVEATGDA
jgi:RND family efflux transporter MFP subunit